MSLHTTSTPRVTKTAQTTRVTPRVARIKAARDAKTTRQAQDAVNYARPLEVDGDWTLQTALELATEYAATWTAEAATAGLTYDGGFASVLEVAQKSARACVWVSGYTYPSRGQLRAWWFVWSSSKSAWYCGEGELERAKVRAAGQVVGVEA